SVSESGCLNLDPLILVRGERDATFVLVIGVQRSYRALSLTWGSAGFEPLISLRKQSHKQRRQFPLTRFGRDEVLANFECHMVQVPLLAMDGDRIIRRVGDGIRFIVADDETFLTMQELHQDLGETRVAVIEHADMPE